VGASARLLRDGAIEGEAFSQAGGTFSVEVPVPMNKQPFLYLDGVAAPSLEGVKASPGRHIWQLAWSEAPIPPRPTILRTANGAGEYTVYWTKSHGAVRYRVESDASGAWRPLGVNPAGEQATFNMPGSGKAHLRVVAVGGARASEPSAAYPLYFGDAPSRAPDGLRVNLYADPPCVVWGEVLGVLEYRLERRRRGETAWKEIYRGLERSLADTDLPSRLRYDAAGGDQLPVWEYRIGAFNGNGGTFNPHTRTSDPRAYLNVDPMPGERFRRQIETFETYGGAYDAWRELYNPILDPYPE